MAYIANGNGTTVHTDTAANGDATSNLEPIDKRKVFVGGLGPDTNEDDLKTYFGQFGSVVHAVVKRDPASGRSRCFAFVTFETSAAVKAVAAVSVHTIKGKKIDPKPAEPRPGEEPCMKIFVGGVDPAMQEEELKEFFQKYGNVKNIEWPKDRMRDNAKKNFAFVEFDNDTIVAEIIKTPKMTIGGRLCDVRKAIPSQQKPQGQFGGFGDYGSPYGSYGYGAGYGAAAAGYGDQYASYYGQGGYDQSGYYGADPNAAGYAGYAGYEQSAYGGYDYGAGGAAAGYPGAAGYGGEAGGAAAGYAPRGGAARGAPRGRGGPMVGGRGASAPGGIAGAGARGGVRGYHPYRRP